MKLLKSYYRLILETAFFFIVFILSVKPLRDFDIWFHVKAGEIFSQMGIIHHDVFSFTAYGREWFPYEWLFQWLVYQTQQLFGFESIQYLIASVVIVQLIFFYLILRQIFKLNTLLSLFTTLFFVGFVFDFFVARPHIFAYTFLVINLYFILLYFFEGKNRLWATIPVTLLWANLHGSIFIDLALFFGYAFVCLIHLFIEHQREYKNKATLFAIWGVVTGILTILPPLGTLQYRLLWIFYQQQQFITKYIDEWTPLVDNPLGFYIYTGTIIGVGICFVLALKDKQNSRFSKKILSSLWIIPLLPFIYLAYSATRNVYLAGITASLILGWSLTKLNFKSYSKKIKLFLLAIAVLVIYGNCWLIYEKDQQQELYYPVNAVSFIKNFSLQGHMFNEYAYGGYLLYHLYPQQKVFFDGRTDIYLCCEMKDTFNISLNKNLPDDTFRELLYTNLWNKYQISFALIRTEKNTIPRKIGRNLESDPNWSLVFWDDYSQIFVRRDGKNDQIIKQFGTKYATPYLQDPFIKGQADQALNEYVRMDETAKSAHTSNDIGYILLGKGRFDEAKNRFNEAVAIDPLYESPYMNLGELAVRDGNYFQAIELYKKAQKLALDRGLIYIRLGQLYIEGYNDVTQAKKIWELGVKQTGDDQTRLQLQKLLQS